MTRKRHMDMLEAWQVMENVTGVDGISFGFEGFGKTPGVFLHAEVNFGEKDHTERSVCVSFMECAKDLGDLYEQPETGRIQRDAVLVLRTINELRKAADYLESKLDPH